jgi:hypothetical protein
MVLEVGPMAINPQKTKWVCSALAGVLLTVGLLAIQWWPLWRDLKVYQALYSSQAAAFWWPPGWRQELRTSFLLEGEARLLEGEVPAPRPQDRHHDELPGRLATAGTVELVSENQGLVSRTTVNPQGWYSFNPQRLPASPFKIRFLSPEGSTTRWLQMGALDPGLHRINWSF